MGHAAGQIHGWKEIANYLDTSERSAKRWEKTRGLPIHRVGGTSRDAVFATCEELQGWLGSAGGRTHALAAAAPSTLIVDGQEMLPNSVPRSLPIPATKRRLLALGVVAILVAGGFAGWHRLQRQRLGQTQPHASAAATHSAVRIPISPLSKRPILLTVKANGLVADVGLRDGDCAPLATRGNPTVNICVRLVGGRLLLDVSDPSMPGPGSANPPKSALVLEPNAEVQVLHPFHFDVQWTESGDAHPAQAPHPK